VVARGSRRVEAWGSSRVEAWGSSRVEAWGSSSVVARGQTTTHHHSEITPKLHGQAVCFVYPGFTSPAPLEGFTIIQVQKLGGTNGWLEREAVLETDGSVILYKRVSGDFLTQENTPQETKWGIGSTVTHPAWSPADQECGPGKYHACSQPYFCDEFRSGDGDKYIAVKIRVADLHAWDNPAYPHKIAFREGVVLHECDRWGG